MTGRCAIPVGRPVAVPAPLVATGSGRRYPLASSRFAAPKDRQQGRLV
jgi:hypothetical protein